MSDLFSLTGKSVLVTGASSGIGREIAIILSEAGAKLVMTGRNESRLTETFKLLPGNYHVKIVCDLASETERNNLINSLPKLNGIIHAAGVMDMKPVKFITEDDVEYVNAINYKAPVMLCQALLENKLLLPGASIVFITSVTADTGWVGISLYAGAKGALQSFAKVLALETAPQKIRVNCLAPGMVKTPMFEQSAEILTNELMQENEKKYPLGFASPKDVAAAAVYLLSDASEKVTGITLTVDGGYSI